MRRFFKVSLSRSMKNSMAAMIPKTAGSMMGIPIVTSKPKICFKAGKVTHASSQYKSRKRNWEQKCGENHK